MIEPTLIQLPLWLIILALAGTVLTAIGVIATAVITVMGMLGINKSLITYHLQVNSRMDQLLEVAKSAAHAAGVKEAEDKQQK